MFLVGRDGTTVRRPHASESPLAVRAALEALLDAPPPAKHPTLEWMEAQASGAPA